MADLIQLPKAAQGKESVNIDQWCIATNGPTKFLAWFDCSKEMLLELIKEGEVVVFNLAFDFMSPLRMAGPGRYARDPVVMPYDFTSAPTNIYMLVQTIAFCVDMQKEDKKTYKEIVEQTLELTRRMKLQQESGIQL